jgi:predicted transcriptional regulator
MRKRANHQAKARLTPAKIPAMEHFLEVKVIHSANYIWTSTPYKSIVAASGGFSVFRLGDFHCCLLAEGPLK